ncbi:pyrimidine 5'-nucleotidase [Caulobacter sp. 17J65-9]|uniref:pyrimidine 5'-nucleotidase n=1 Tax=Caulobacter sp. 17J65-9 TaxID=2709382 RepID=UPI0013CC34D3|nr:pyrimidine 5'-nucleotidase [Caulobacter sp. 17J65-9]NEX93780.1 pyrimidine 5'-nucleotidase [Caulobacter sp. 17J65-9]
MSADLSRVETWIFDLDNTLYPAECEYMALIEGKMTAFVMRETGLARDEAKALQKSYLHEHGTTLAGLMANHGIDPHAFLDEVHDVAMDRLLPDPALLAALTRLPGRRLVFTNGGSKHAARVLERLEIADLFEDVFHLEAADFVPKPAQATYENLVRIHGVDPRAAAFFEDSERNLKPAAVLGMATVLVGAHAAQCSADFVHHRTDKLPPFLMDARIRTAA